ncbi:hypothetical protein POTOM_050285 [Populus tomentosa]|uniref:DUF4283 domain-containing protein n=1 Tax=Populus tomentosa TaxID=118781 RepID=A0A8X7Y3H7_POPTO|nr:hypothetical protein POTOM_050285 [Populus tomentosa]
MIADHYLTPRQWQLSFDPFEATIEKVAAWVRLPDLEMEYYDISVLWKIGNHIDRNLKIDRTTSIGTRGNYARICVEVDLTKPLFISALHARRSSCQINFSARNGEIKEGSKVTVTVEASTLEIPSLLEQLKQKAEKEGSDHAVIKLKPAES